MVEPRFEAVVQDAEAGASEGRAAVPLPRDTAAPRPPPEIRIPGFRIVRRLGTGGMARVYLAASEFDDSRVALKVAAEAIGESGLSRLRHEAAILERLDSPHLPRFGQILSADGRFVLAMEYIQGRPLAEVAGEAQDLEARAKVVGLALQGVVLGLLDLHAAGIVHRDLKPDNILVRPDGTGVLVDLGLAVARDVARVTTQGMIVGTPTYMAPEQLTTRRQEGPSTDLYQLGLVLLRLLSGKLPSGIHEAIKEAHDRMLHPVGPTAPRLSPRIPVALTAWLDRILVPDPDHRPPPGLALEEIFPLLVGLSEGLAELTPADLRSRSETLVRTRPLVAGTRRPDPRKPLPGSDPDATLEFDPSASRRELDRMRVDPIAPAPAAGPEAPEIPPVAPDRAIGPAAPEYPYGFLGLCATALAAAFTFALAVGRLLVS